MIGINSNQQIVILLENCSGFEQLGALKQALISLLINIDCSGNHTDSIFDDIREVAWLLKSMEFSDDQLTKIEISLKNNTDLRDEFALAS